MTSAVVPRLATLVADDLRAQILRRRAPVSSLPRQSDLRAFYGVGPASIREALRMLEAEGLVTVRRGSNGGAAVHPPCDGPVAQRIGLALQACRADVDDLARSIQDVEGIVAAACAGDPARRTLVHLLTANLASAERAADDLREHARLARAFHRLLLDHTPARTTAMIRRSLAAVWAAQEVEPVVRPTWRYRVVAEHRLIVERLRAGDAVGAAGVARRHLAAAQQATLSDAGRQVVDASSMYASRAIRDHAVRRTLEDAPAEAARLVEPVRHACVWS